MPRPSRGAGPYRARLSSAAAVAAKTKAPAGEALLCARRAGPPDPIPSRRVPSRPVPSRPAAHFPHRAAIGYPHQYEAFNINVSTEPWLPLSELASRRGIIGGVKVMVGLWARV
jgi:hypothetical protein